MTPENDLLAGITGRPSTPPPDTLIPPKTPRGPKPQPPPTYTIDDLQAAMRRNGWQEPDIVKGSAIAWHEGAQGRAQANRRATAAENATLTGGRGLPEDSVGPFQINWSAHAPWVQKEFGYNREDLYDIDKNAQVAAALRYGGPGRKPSGWSPWKLANERFHQQYLPLARSAYARSDQSRLKPEDDVAAGIIPDNPRGDSSTATPPALAGEDVQVPQQQPATSATQAVPPSVLTENNRNAITRPRTVEQPDQQPVPTSPGDAELHGEISPVTPEYRKAQERYSQIDTVAKAAVTRMQQQNRAAQQRRAQETKRNAMIEAGRAQMIKDASDRASETFQHTDPISGAQTQAAAFRDLASAVMAKPADVVKWSRGQRQQPGTFDLSSQTPLENLIARKSTSTRQAFAPVALSESAIRSSKDPVRDAIRSQVISEGVGSPTPTTLNRTGPRPVDTAAANEAVNREVERRVAEQNQAIAERKRLFDQMTPEARDAFQKQVGSYIGQILESGGGKGGTMGWRDFRAQSYRLAAGLADVASKLPGDSDRERQMADYLRTQAMAMEDAVSKVNEVAPLSVKQQAAQHVVNLAGGLVLNSPAMVTNPVAGFAALSALQARGKNLSLAETLKESAVGAGTGLVFEGAAKFLPPASGSFTDTAKALGKQSAAIGAGTAAVELAAGRSPGQAASAAVQNVFLHGIFRAPELTDIGLKAGGERIAASDLPENLRSAGARVAGREPIIAKKEGSSEYGSVFLDPEAEARAQAINQAAARAYREGDAERGDELAAEAKKAREDHIVKPLTTAEAKNIGNRRVVEMPAAEFEDMMRRAGHSQPEGAIGKEPTTEVPRLKGNEPETKGVTETPKPTEPTSSPETSKELGTAYNEDGSVSLRRYPWVRGPKYDDSHTITVQEDGESSKVTPYQLAESHIRTLEKEGENPSEFIAAVFPDGSRSLIHNSQIQFPESEVKTDAVETGQQSQSDLGQHPGLSPGTDIPADAEQVREGDRGQAGSRGGTVKLPSTPKEESAPAGLSQPQPAAGLRGKDDGLTPQQTTEPPAAVTERRSAERKADIDYLNQQMQTIGGNAKANADGSITLQVSPTTRAVHPDFASARKDMEQRLAAGENLDDIFDEFQGKKPTAPTTPKPQPKTPVTARAPENLPQHLAGAKPRYSYRDKAFEVDFASDLDRAAYITAQKTPSKADSEYMRWARIKTGMSEPEVRAHGQRVKDVIKDIARTAEPGRLNVPEQPRGKQSTIGLTEGLSNAGKVISENLYRGMFDRMEQGKLPAPFPAEKQPAFERFAKQEYDAGRVKSWENLRDMAQHFDANQAPSITGALRTAGSEVRAGLDESIKAIEAILKDVGKSQMPRMGPAFDEKTYENLKPHLIASTKHFYKAGMSLADALRALLQHLENVVKWSKEQIAQLRPYIMRFMADLKSGDINLEEGESSTVDSGAHDAAHSPTNTRPEPTENQIEAGNYKKGHVRVAGLDVSIENPEGSVRRGTDRNGKEWEVTLKDHYGYIRGYEEGADGEHVDIFIKPSTPLGYAGPLFVVNQKKPGNGHFDEHKVMLGYADVVEAEAAYRRNYTKDHDGIRSIASYDSPEEFKGWLESGDLTKVADGQYGTIEEPNVPNIARYIADQFAQGAEYRTIVQVRSEIGNQLLSGNIEPGTQAAKQVDEAVELGVVMRAREIVREFANTSEEGNYRALLKLYDQQPNLAVKTSTSVQNQAYSTPIPLAYIASRLAGITIQTTVGEPTAGNGALLIEADPPKITANELDEARGDNLEATLGLAHLTRNDAASVELAKPRSLDVVIANPPFGVVKEGGQSKTFQITPQYSTTEIDHAIAFKSLEAMKDGGSAVLIVGGVNAVDPAERAKGYSGAAKRGFYYELYQEYNVVDHFTVNGDLYKKQGAGWPVDVIVIHGHSKSSRRLPAADVPRIYNSWDQLEGVLNEPYRELLDARRAEQYGERKPRGSMQGGSNQGIRGPEFRPGRLPEPVDESATGTLGSGGRGGKPVHGGQLVSGPRSSGSGGTGPEPEQGGSDIIGTEPAATPEPIGSTRIPTGDNAEEQSASGTDLQGNGPGELGGQPARTPTERRPVEAVDITKQQAPYRPASQKGAPLDTLVPINMKSSVERALADISAKYGDIDSFIAKELGYKGADEIGKYLSAEQVDGIALAIDNIRQDSAVIIGDQGGIGKGRIAAAVIWWGTLNKRPVIFVTQAPDLFKDIVRDLVNIGKGKREDWAKWALMTNNSKSVALDDDGEVLMRTPDAGRHNARLAGMREKNSLGKHKVIFTTYSQMQNVKDRSTGVVGPTERQRFLRHFSENAILVFDESHNAGGQGEKRETKKQKQAKAAFGADYVDDRAKFAREIIGRAHGVVYLSATYAKHPQVMDLYSKTDMRLAVKDPKDIGKAIAKGGVPLQQVVASMLAEAGQMIRRERDMSGLEFTSKTIPVDRVLANHVANAMQQIREFDDAKNQKVSDLDDQLQETGSVRGMDIAISGAGMSSTTFTSLLHNALADMSMMLKVDGVAQEAIESIKAGRKPVIAVAKTMGAFIEHFAAENDLKVGDAVELDFSHVLQRYLERSREVTIRGPHGEMERRYLTDEQLGPRGLALYNKAKDFINLIDFSSMPMSPIDYIKAKVQEAGYTIGEITGREHAIRYQSKMKRAGEGVSTAGGTEPIAQMRLDKEKIAARLKELKTSPETVQEIGSLRRRLRDIDVMLKGPDESKAKAAQMFFDAYYYRRPTTERSTNGRNKTIVDFNKNRVDALIINESGSTGISLHASTDFLPAEQTKQREMLVAQPHLNIDTFMQTLWRIDRTGQIIKPTYALLSGDIPAEIRPAAVLMRKMASLNANTTAAKGGAYESKDMPDFMNLYGDRVVAELMWEHQDIRQKLSVRLREKPNGGYEPENAMAKVTGRIPLLPLVEQEQLYDLLANEYKGLIERLDAMSENQLEAKTLDLGAKQIDRTEIFAGSNQDSPFARSAQAETMEVKKVGKPYTSEQVLGQLQKTLNASGAKTLTQLQHEGQQALRPLIADTTERMNEYIRGVVDEIEKEAKAQVQETKLRNNLNEWIDAIEQLPVGRTVQFEIGDGDEISYTRGVVTKVEQRGKPKSPVAMGSWKITVAVPDATRHITIPLSQIHEVKGVNNTLARVEGRMQQVPILEAFDHGQSDVREDRVIMTGNLLAAYDQFPKGRIINFTDEHGAVQQGILMAQDFNLARELDKQPVVFANPDHIIRFLDGKRGERLVNTPDGNLRITMDRSGDIHIATEVSKAKGGTYYLNPQILAALRPREFVKSGKNMVVDIDPREAPAVIDAIRNAGFTLQTDSFKESARDITGEKKSEKETTDTRGILARHRPGEEVSMRRLSMPDLLKQVAGEVQGHRLRMNSALGELLRRWRGDQGLADEFYNAKGIKKLQVKLSSLIARHPEQATPIRNLLREIDRASQDTNTLVVYSDTSSLVHEEFHRTSEQQAQGKGLRLRHADVEVLMQHPALSKATNALMRTGMYSGATGNAIEETAAFIWEGNYEQFGITDTEAEDYIDQWMLSYAKANGVDTIKEFENARAETEQFIESEHQRINNQQRSVAGDQTGARENIGLERNSDNERRKDVSGVAEEGQTRDQKTLAGDEDGEGLARARDLGMTHSGSEAGAVNLSEIAKGLRGILDLPSRESRQQIQPVLDRMAEQHRQVRGAEFEAARLTRSVADMIKDMPEDEQTAIIDAMEHKYEGPFWDVLSPEQQAVADSLKPIHDMIERYNHRHQVFSEKEMPDDLRHLFHWWKDPKTGRPFQTQYGEFARTGPSSRQRSIESYQEGRDDNGLEMASTNPGEILGQTLIQLIQVKEARQLVAVLKRWRLNDPAGPKLRGIVSEIPKGFEDRYEKINIPPLKRTRYIPQEGGPGMLIQQPTYALKEIAPVLNAYFVKPDWSKLDEVFFAMKSLKLSLSFFHGLGLIWKNMTMFRFRNIHDVREGLKQLHEMDDTMKRLYQNGLETALKNEYEDINAAYGHFHRKSWVGRVMDLSHKNPMTNLIFNIVRVGLKNSYAYHAYERMVQRYIDAAERENGGLLNPRQLEAAKNRAARDVVNRASSLFSGEDMRWGAIEAADITNKLYFSPRARRIWDKALISKTWQREHLIEAKNIVKSALMPKTMGPIRREYYKQLAGAIFILAISDMMNWFMTRWMDGQGTHMWNNPTGSIFSVRLPWNEPSYPTTFTERVGKYKTPETETRTVKGAPAFVRPFKAITEVPEMLTAVYHTVSGNMSNAKRDIVELVSAKVHPIWQTLANQMTFDKQKRKQGETERLKAIAGDMAPIAGDTPAQVIRGRRNPFDLIPWTVGAPVQKGRSEEQSVPPPRHHR